MIKPADKTNELLGKIGSLGNYAELSDFEYRVFKRDIDAIQKNNPEYGLMLHGMLSAGLGKHEDAVSYFESSMRYSSGTNFAVVGNYAESLKRLGCWTESLKVFMAALTLNPLSESVSQSIGSLVALTFDLEAGERAMKLVRNSAPGQDFKFIETLSWLQEKVEEVGVDAQEVRRIAKFCEEILRKNHYTTAGHCHRTISFDGGLMLYVEYAFEASADVLFRLNDELSELIASDESLVDWGRYSICFAYGNRERFEGHKNGR